MQTHLSHLGYPGPVLPSDSICSDYDLELSHAIVYHLSGTHHDVQTTCSQ